MGVSLARIVVFVDETLNDVVYAVPFADGDEEAWVWTLAEHPSTSPQWSLRARGDPVERRMGEGVELLRDRGRGAGRSGREGV